ncbi:MAG: hypothetical protein H7Y43_05475, partial [Akkermansiaceae bacterium]|nr:hypothetical protein [Verrucomicrobiales bacterium]
KELAAAIGTKAANVHSWFHSTAKRNPSIVKVDGGHYRLDGSGRSAPAPVTTSKATKAKAKPAPAKPAQAKPAKARATGTKPGGLASRIVKVLEKAGDGGVSVKEIAGKVGAKYRNISIWFATTGKKNPSIKKLGPALYKIG